MADYDTTPPWDLQSLRRIVIENGVTSIGDSAFLGSDSLTSVSLPTSVTVIENWAFGGTGLKDVTIPEGVACIGSHAFTSCDALESVTIPGSVRIATEPFSNCSHLREILVAPSNTAFRSVDGILFSRDGTELVQYPAGKMRNTYELPAGVTHIGSNAFLGCSQLKSVTIPEGVASIKLAAFMYCDGLKSLTIPKSVTLIENLAFDGCSLSDVYYSGTKVQWKGISIEDYNEGLDSATIHCSDGDIGDTVEENDPTQWPINQKEVFIKQQTNKTCTLATVTMMVRRRAILDGVSDWRSMTESALSAVAWCSSGLIEAFRYRGMQGATDSIRNKTLSQKKDYLISMLQQHPEGIGVYRYTSGVQRHAILLTDYDQATDTFYCADPQRQTGRVPLVQCSIRGDDANHTLSPQDAILNVLHRTYYIAKNAPQKNIASTVIRTDCPIELRLTINGETLDSTGLDGMSRNSYAVMTASGQGQNRSVEVQISRGDSQDEIAVEARGTSTGAATFTVTHTYADDTSEQYAFKNIPVKDSTVISTAGLYPQSTVLLTVADASAPAQETDGWAANPNEEISRPLDASDTDGSGIPDTPDDGQLHGKISVSGVYNAEGEQVTLSVTPDPGYQLDSITVAEDGGNRQVYVSGSGNTYTFAMPAYDVTVQAEFTKIR